MHPDQIAIGADDVARMVSEQFPDFDGEPVSRVESSGTVNAIFRIGSRAAARFPLRASDPASCAAELRSEAKAMSELAIHSPVPTPRPIGLGRPDRSHPLPWAMQTWVDGRVATPDGLAESSTFATALADLITALRAADPRGRTFDGRGRGGHLPDHDAWMATCFEQSTGLLDVPRLREMWARLRELPQVDPPVMSHKDLIPYNLLVEGECLVGVIDGGGFGPADPALDLVAAWHMLDRDRRNDVRSRLRSGELEWRRGAAWAFQQAMGLVWYYRTSHPAMAALGQSTLRRLLESPDLL